MASERSEREILIGLIGVTGAGKSTFASKASGRTDLKIGRTLKSCTQDPQSIRFRLDGHPINLVDTPGFDDDERTDVEILQAIVEWLSKNRSRKRQKYLDGLILLHPITSNRIGGTERKRTRLLQAILGEDAYKRIIIATTMWDDLKNDGGKFEYRLTGRMEEGEVWHDMCKKGAVVLRHHNNPESAHDIIRKIMAKSLAENGGVSVRFEADLIQARGRVRETHAGKLTAREIKKAIDNCEKDLAELDSAKPSPKDPNRREWDKERHEVAKTLQKLQVQQKKLDGLVVRGVMKWFAKIFK
ncbi:hypothetical protein OQA88_11891 [Cercophora sp. LCS_1]